MGKRRRSECRKQKKRVVLKRQPSTVLLSHEKNLNERAYFFENSDYNEGEDKERDLQTEEADPSDSRSKR